MTPVARALEEVLKPHICGRKSVGIPLYSTATGTLATDVVNFDAKYWGDHLRSPVMFADAVRALLDDHTEQLPPIFLEIGPHSALKGPLRQIIQSSHPDAEDQSFAYLPTILRSQDSLKSLLATIGHLHCQGFPVNLAQANPPAPVVTTLPNYPWDHSKEYWSESRLSHAWRTRDHLHHELLGAIYPAMGASVSTWRNMLHSTDVLWLQDHVVANCVVFPCVGYIAMIGEAIRQATGSEAYVVRDLVLKSAMTIRSSETIEIITTMKPLALTHFTNSSWFQWSISSFNGSSWVQHCVGEARAAATSGPKEDEPNNSDASQVSYRKVPEKALYRRLKRLGIDFGIHFQRLHDISAHTTEQKARATIGLGNKDGQADGPRYIVHPTAIDALLQLSVVAMHKGLSRHMTSLKIPNRLGRIEVLGGWNSEMAAEATAQLSSTGSTKKVLTNAKSVLTSEDSGPKRVISLHNVSFIDVDVDDDISSIQQVEDKHSAGRCVWQPAIEFCNVKDLLLPGLVAPKVKQALEAVTTLCILQFLDAVEDLKPRSSEQQPGIVGHLVKHVAWLQEQRNLALAGSFRHLPDAVGWPNLDRVSRKLLLEQAKLRLDSYNNHSASITGNLTISLAEPETAKAVLLGQQHPLQVCLEGERLSEFYNYLNQLLDFKNFIALSGHSNSNLRVLEIGAGTGSTTELLLQQLVTSSGIPMYSEFVFTDVSAGFFAKARERLRKWNSVEYKVLDITRDPADQDFTLGQFDLIVASNASLSLPSSAVKSHQTHSSVYMYLHNQARGFVSSKGAPKLTADTIGYSYYTLTPSDLDPCSFFAEAWRTALHARASHTSVFQSVSLFSLVSHRMTCLWSSRAVASRHWLIQLSN